MYLWAYLLSLLSHVAFATNLELSIFGRVSMVPLPDSKGCFLVQTYESPFTLIQIKHSYLLYTVSVNDCLIIPPQTKVKCHRIGINYVFPYNFRIRFFVPLPFLRHMVWKLKKLIGK